MTHEQEYINEVSLENLISNHNNLQGNNTNTATYGDNLVVSHNINSAEAWANQNPFKKPLRTTFSMVFLCTKGNATIRCNSKECHIQTNTLFVCRPGNVLEFIDGHLDQYSAICSPDKPIGPLSLPLQKLLPHYTELEELTILKLNPSEAKKLNTMIRYLKEAIQTNSDLLFYHEAIKTQASAFAFCFLNILCSGLDLKNSTQHTTHFRQQDYVRQFMSLLNLHYREQRRVTFYSEQMHITPKYLGSIVTHQTGRTVSDWIDHFVISEAKMLLGYSNLTIQEITYKLNFPNQSFFCKYFKSHTGMTPSEFRSGKQ